ncbi:A24 family peptidase [Pelagibacterium limicola]|uniref:A24 family peptidase n=1 Tax=Pelagibacterium limicola TaxID=2791022 RepID=UPI003CCD1DC8
MAWALLFVFPALMAFAAFSDLLTMRISNKLVLATAASFFVLALVVGFDIAQIGWHIAAGALVLAITFGFFAAGWIGGGDAKLAAAIALWFGFEPMLPFLLYASIYGGALTLLILIGRRYMLPAPLMQIGWIERLHNEKTGIPYGIALAAAALMVYPASPVFLALVK